MLADRARLIDAAIEYARLERHIFACSIRRAPGNSGGDSGDTLHGEGPAQQGCRLLGRKEIFGRPAVWAGAIWGDGIDNQ